MMTKQNTVFYLKSKAETIINEKHIDYMLDSTYITVI